MKNYLLALCLFYSFSLFAQDTTQRSGVMRVQVPEPEDTVWVSYAGFTSADTISNEVDEVERVDNPAGMEDIIFGVETTFAELTWETVKNNDSLLINYSDYQIRSFTLILKQDGKRIETLKTEGSTLTKEMKRSIKRLKAGELIFTQIKYEDGRGNIHHLPEKLVIPYKKKGAKRRIGIVKP